MREKKLTDSQKSYICSVIEALQYSTDLKLPHSLNSEEFSEEDLKVGNAVIGLVFHAIVKGEHGTSETGLDRKDIRRFSGTVINNSPGSKILYETRQGFVHSSPSYSKLGRNHSNRVRARDK